MSSLDLFRPLLFLGDRLRLRAELLFRFDQVVYRPLKFLPNCSKQLRCRTIIHLKNILFHCHLCRFVPRLISLTSNVDLLKRVVFDGSSHLAKMLRAIVRHGGKDADS